MPHAIRATSVQCQDTVPAPSTWQSLIGHNSHPQAHDPGPLHTLEPPSINTPLPSALEGKGVVRDLVPSLRAPLSLTSSFHSAPPCSFTPLRNSSRSDSIQPTQGTSTAPIAAREHSPTNSPVFEPGKDLQKWRCDVSQWVETITAAAQKNDDGV